MLWNIHHYDIVVDQILGFDAILFYQNSRLMLLNPIKSPSLPATEKAGRLTQGATDIHLDFQSLY